MLALTAAVLSLVPGFRVQPPGSGSCPAQSARRCSPARACQFDVNAALTDLNAAVAAEDYAEAARLKKLIAEAAPEAAGATTWPEAMPVWLLERLEQLGLRFPTPIQSAALRAPADAVLRAPTGSGKTVAFLCVLLARCEAELQRRSEATLRAVTSSTLTPTQAMEVLAPALTTLDGGGPAAGAAKDPFYGMRLRGAPPAIVLVPDGDALLAEQVAGTAYALLGGYARASRSWTPGASDSLFRYTGAQGVPRARAARGRGRRGVRGGRARRRRPRRVCGDARGRGPERGADVQCARARRR